MGPHPQEAGLSRRVPLPVHGVRGQFRLQLRYGERQPEHGAVSRGQRVLSGQADRFALQAEGHPGDHAPASDLSHLAQHFLLPGCMRALLCCPVGQLLADGCTFTYGIPDFFWLSHVDQVSAEQNEERHLHFAYAAVPVLHHDFCNAQRALRRLTRRSPWRLYTP
ncbi:magnetosome protein Mad2 [Fundidesulfovibrio magnetotacticus]|uniref:Magnetosome protein Mad2 n=1 Tax=Fundidesulfovibrio magnetotacticus TaxID=2730080 RepID=A0A6V8LPN0_9BACT|nr:magnetosome protein Mad2 [Fundidesulfovibrio magnetotacticus]